VTVQESDLQDSAGGKPSYNLRTLTRALQYARRAWATYGLKRALYDGLAMAFLTQLHPGSAPLLEGILQRLILGSSKPKEIKVPSLKFST
jgi:midasin